MTLETNLISEYLRSFPQKSISELCKFNCSEISEIIVDLPFEIICDVINRLPLSHAGEVIIYFPDDLFKKVYSILDPVRMARIILEAPEDLVQSKLKLLSTRAGNNWEEDGHDHHDHAHGSYDVHFWLDPNNATQIIKGIIRELSKVYPENINIYKENAKKAIKKIKKTDLVIKSMLNSIQDKPYIVFHDAYQYFEKAYNLKPAGSILLNPELPPSAKRIIKIKTKIKNLNATCVFKEPQFRAKIVDTVIEVLRIYLS